MAFNRYRDDMKFEKTVTVDVGLLKWYEKWQFHDDKVAGMDVNLVHFARNVDGQHKMVVEVFLNRHLLSSLWHAIANVKIVLSNSEGKTIPHEEKFRFDYDSKLLLHTIPYKDVVELNGSEHGGLNLTVSIECTEVFGYGKDASYKVNFAQFSKLPDKVALSIGGELIHISAQILVTSSAYFRERILRTFAPDHDQDVSANTSGVFKKNSDEGSSVCSSFEKLSGSMKSLSTSSVLTEKALRDDDYDDLRTNDGHDDFVIDVDDAYCDCTGEQLENRTDFLLLLEFLYPVNKNVDSGTVRKILPLAYVFKMTVILNQCERYMCSAAADDMDLRTRLEWAAKYHMADLQHHILLKITSKEQMSKIMSRENPRILDLSKTTAIALLELAFTKKWICH